jgi:integral membrane protein
VETSVSREALSKGLPAGKSQVTAGFSAFRGGRKEKYSLFGLLSLFYGENYMLSLFRWVGRFEGISFLLLLFIAMPIKYIMGEPKAVSVVGMAHGGLFLAYVAMANYLALELRWTRKVWLLSMAAAVFPFGTFIFEKKHMP